MEHFSLKDFKLGLKEQLRVAKIVLLTVPLFHWFAGGGSSQGDEIILPKAVWIGLLLQSGRLLDISFIGPPLEEIEMIAALSLCPGSYLYITKDLIMGVDMTGVPQYRASRGGSPNPS
ncbi:unnamed protein product [marine sediment metagenome]|uniref:Uncharacterized protein n=1 Tax=marine sediment metagenome TaxID=412755 RepID=X1SRK9_9ZZZZ